MNLFYHPELNGTGLITLNEDESRHAVSVLRMKEGDKMLLTNGKGQFAFGTIQNAGKKKCDVEITEIVDASNKRNYHLSIAIAPTKNIDRFEWFLEKATEIGCDEIFPVICSHSERRILKNERLEKVMLAAMKQCLQPQLPVLHTLLDLDKFINLATVYDQMFICHIPEVKNDFMPPLINSPLLSSKVQAGKKMLVLIGPEGGFSNEEVKLAEAKGFECVSLGQNRLRVETAGVVVCAQVAQKGN